MRSASDGIAGLPSSEETRSLAVRPQSGAWKPGFTRKARCCKTPVLQKNVWQVFAMQKCRKPRKRSSVSILAVVKTMSIARFFEFFTSASPENKPHERHSHSKNSARHIRA